MEPQNTVARFAPDQPHGELARHDAFEVHEVETARLGEQRVAVGLEHEAERRDGIRERNLLPVGVLLRHVKIGPVDQERSTSSAGNPAISTRSHGVWESWIRALEQDACRGVVFVFLLAHRPERTVRVGALTHRDERSVRLRHLDVADVTGIADS